MFNLLPQTVKSRIIFDYKLRLIIVILLFFILTQISVAIFVSPSLISSHYREKDLSIRGEKMSEFLASLEIASTTAQIKSFNDKLQAVNESMKYNKFIGVIDSVLAQKSPSIKIESFNYLVTGEDTSSLVISGVGGTREAVVKFSDKLKGVPTFKKVELPISNLAKDSNIKFTITVSVEE